MTGGDTVIWFDLDGTLVEYDRSFAAIFETAVGRPAPDAHAVFTERLFDGLDAVDETPYEQAFAEAIARTDLAGDPVALADSYCDAEVAAATVPDETRAVVTRIANDHHVGVLTNGVGHLQRRKLHITGLEDPIDTIVVSGEEGYRKPDTRLFERAADRLPGTAHVFVGDSPEADVVGASQAGWHPVLLGDPDTPLTIDVDPAATISALTELPQVLDTNGW